MTQRFHPGDLLIDETSSYGAPPHAGSEALTEAERAALQRWSERLVFWLSQVNGTRVGHIVLGLLAARPSSPVHTQITIARLPPEQTTAVTENHFDAFDPARGVSVLPTSCILVPANDGWAGGRFSSAPMRNPASVLVHELTHALMAVHGLTHLANRPLTGAIRGWDTPTYPSFNEFCATVVQNMMLSETGSVLSDGYLATVDDPWIVSAPGAASAASLFGEEGTTSVDMPNYVGSYRQPLEYLDTHLPALTNQLAALADIAFNPFAFMRTRGGSGSTEMPGGAAGAARRPGHTDTTAP